MTGMVQNVIINKGYGFIRGADGAEYFFHHSGVIGGRPAFHELTRGAEVRFDEDEPGLKGPRAKGIERL